MGNVKHLILTIMTLLALTNINAQGIKIYKSDKTVITINYNDLDSIVACDYIDKEEFVDMGLSVKWATHNVGAKYPEDDGYYYAWGEVEQKDEYVHENCITYKCEMNDISGNPLYDVATTITGARMPREEEVRELIENSSFEWTEQNGVKGIVVTSNINGNKIFLPASGDIYEKEYSYWRRAASYWTSTPSENSKTCSQRLYFNEYSFEIRTGERFYGRVIRAVMDY